MNQPGAKRPIGYWLKRADEAITKHSNKALSEQGLTRFHWQALNLIYEAGNVTKESLLAELRDFVSVEQFDEILAAFETQGWLTRRLRSLELTQAGRESHANALRRQTEVRKQAFQGVSEDEYATVMRVLQRIVDNLESEEPAVH